MIFQTVGNKENPAVLFFHAMGVTGESSRPAADHGACTGGARFERVKVPNLSCTTEAPWFFFRKVLTINVKHSNIFLNCKE